MLRTSSSSFFLFLSLTGNIWCPFGEKEKALFSAIKEGRVKKVRELLKQGVDVNTVSPTGKLPLHYAISYECEEAFDKRNEIFKLLLEYKADITACDRGGMRPLAWAALKGNVVVAELLLGKHIDVNTKAPSVGRGWTALHHAIRSPKIVELLLNNGAKVNVRDENGMTPLHAAAGYGITYVMEQLLAKGADIEAADRVGRTPLYYAVYKGRPTNIDLLLQRGASVDTPDDDKQTPLHRAATGEYSLMIEPLVEYKADVNARDNAGRTPLHLAALYACRTTARWLIEAGADVNAKDDEGKTPLQLARNKKTIQTLIHVGADPSCINEEDPNYERLEALRQKRDHKRHRS
jgi:ankyrin repeat protein